MSLLVTFCCYSSCNGVFGPEAAATEYTTKLIETKTPLTLTLSPQIDPYLPYEFTCEGMLQRMNAFIERQVWTSAVDDSWIMLERGTISILKLSAIVPVQVGVVAVQTLALCESRKAKQFFSVCVTSLAVYTHKSFGSRRIT